MSGYPKEGMTRFSSTEAEQYIATIPVSVQLETPEQIRRFELLRLAFFVLKLRKLEDRQGEEVEFRRNLLHHVIFQQVLTLMKLGAHEQARQIIATCRHS